MHRSALRIERALAKRHREMTRALMEIDPGSVATTFDLLDGVVAFFGPGLFVNHATAVGLEGTVGANHLELLERRAADVGVQPAIETVDAITPHALVELLSDRGYVPGDDTSVLVRPLSTPVTTADPTHVVTEVSDDEVTEWADISSQGWGHTEPGPLSANDRFAEIAHRSGTPGLLIAREKTTGRGVACADLHVEGDVAILGGASTLPTERARGAQSTLVRYRLVTGHAMGATIAVATTAPESQSERNLERLGFTRSHTKRLWRRPSGIEI